ncbi:caspase recruitment domain-containing protein 19-like [Gadus macrocephalus]|uniref:caspase recruitment domain-containing protein 19-like n=1 Tax=Gadus macrocephalus TaxID=80720 RepID=UPI0028CB3170|nr:caspase recruitment domain-containing protein 19-like [Gadus macrocephalus]
MDTALLDRLVLQLNRIHPQILNDHEAQRFRNLAAATRGRLSGLLEHLQQEGDEACLGFYQALQLHAEDLYCTLPSRVSLRGHWVKTLAMSTETVEILCFVPRLRMMWWPWFYLSCFCLTVGLTALYYYGALVSLLIVVVFCL